MRAVVWMIQENLRMSKQYVVDNDLMFPVNLCYFLFLLTQEECWAAPEIRSLIYEYAWYIGNMSANPFAYSSSRYSEMLNSRDVPATGHLPVQASTGQPVAESEDRDHDTIPTPRFLRSSSVGNSFTPNGGNNFKELWSWPTKTSNLRTSLWQPSLLHKRFRVGK